MQEATRKDIGMLSGESAAAAGKVISLLLGPVFMVTAMALPLGLTGPQQRLLGLIALVMTYWITRALPIPVTAICALGLAVVMKIASAQTVFSAVASPTLFLLIGGFIMTQSMTKYGLGKRIALHVLSIPGIAGSTYRIVMAFGTIAMVLSGVMENGAVAAVLLPIGMGLIRALEGDIREEAHLADDGSPLRFGTALMLITGYGATVGALLTPFGDAVILTGWYFLRNHFGLTIHVGTWLMLSVPIVLTLFLVLCGMVLLVNRPEVHKLRRAAGNLRAQRRQLGPASRGEINTAIAFCTAVGLLLLPPLTAIVSGYGSAAYRFVFSRFNPAAVITLSAVLLFILPLGKGRGSTLRWRDTRGMDWGPVLLMGSGLALAHLMDRTGLAAIIGHTFSSHLAGTGAIGIYIFAAAAAMMFSEFTSNFVSITILVPIIPSIAAAGGGSPVIATLIATFAALYGFTLPISTSANVIIYGSGKVPFLKMFKTGLLVDLSGMVIVVIGVLLMTRLLGIG